MTPKKDDINPDDIEGIECKFSTYIRGPYEGNGAPDDLICVKEVVHLKNGDKVPRIRNFINVERDYYITKPGFRNHKEWKPWAPIDTLQKDSCRQSELQDAVARKLEFRGQNKSLRNIQFNMPYIYGTNITPTAILKYKYMKKWPDAVSPYRVAMMDIETDMTTVGKNYDDGDPITIQISMKEQGYFVYVKSYLSDIENPIEKIHKEFRDQFGHVIDERKLNIIVEEARNPLEAIKMAVNKLHEWQPDLVAFWNMNFDIPRIIKTIEKYGGDVGDIFSDPSVPRKFRKAYYKQGPEKEITASGRVKTLSWYDRWHTFYIPASFYFVDQGCVWRKIRMANGKEPMGLDAVLRKYTKVSKLKNDLAKGLTGAQWHTHMQTFEKIAYCAYAMFDTISCEILEELPSVQDLTMSLGVAIGWSDIDIFPSQPKRIADDKHFMLLDHGYVLAQTSSDGGSDFDEAGPARDGWIITLSAHLLVENGLCCIKDNPEIRTLIRKAVYDLDVKGAYPHGQIVGNTARDTTVGEVSKIENVDLQVQRLAGLNLMAGTVNASEIMMQVCGTPTFQSMLDAFHEDHGLAA